MSSNIPHERNPELILKPDVMASSTAEVPIVKRNNDVLAIYVITEIQRLLDESDGDIDTDAIKDLAECSDLSFVVHDLPKTDANNNVALKNFKQLKATSKVAAFSGDCNAMFLIHEGTVHMFRLFKYINDNKDQHTFACTVPSGLGAALNEAVEM